VQYLHNALYVGLREHTTDALVVEIGERALVETARVHRATLGEMIDDEIDEFDLVPAQIFLCHETGERLLRRIMNLSRIYAALIAHLGCLAFESQGAIASQR